MKASLIRIDILDILHKGDHWRQCERQQIANDKDKNRLIAL